MFYFWIWISSCSSVFHHWLSQRVTIAYYGKCIVVLDAYSHSNTLEYYGECSFHPPQTYSNILCSHVDYLFVSIAILHVFLTPRSPPSQNLCMGATLKTIGKIVHIHLEKYCIMGAQPWVLWGMQLNFLEMYPFTRFIQVVLLCVQ